MGNVTELIRSVENSGDGERDISQELFALVYDELRNIAKQRMISESQGHTLQPTALVNEVYMKLAGRQIQWKNRAHFFGVAARAMRRVLVDAARTKNRLKRGGERAKLPLTDSVAVAQSLSSELVELDEALQELEKVAPDKAELVRLHFFGGLTIVQCAEVMGVSKSTTERSWRFARAWLRNYMAKD